MISGLEDSPVGAVLLSTVLFTLSHPFMWGVFSYTLREPEMLDSLLMMGSLWGLFILRPRIYGCVSFHIF